MDLLTTKNIVLTIIAAVFTYLQTKLTTLAKPATPSVPGQKVQEQRAADPQEPAPPELHRNASVLLHKRRQAGRSVPERGDGLHPRHPLPSHEAVPQDEANGPRPPRQDLLLPADALHRLHPRHRHLPQRH